MSIEIDWDKLLQDGDELSEKIRVFLDNQFQALSLPPYIASISVTSFDLGKSSPEITIRDITDPFPEFYEDESQDNAAAIAAAEFASRRHSIAEELYPDTSRHHLHSSSSSRTATSLGRTSMEGNDQNADTDSILGAEPPHYFYPSLLPNSVYSPGLASPRRGVYAASPSLGPRPVPPMHTNSAFPGTPPVFASRVNANFSSNISNANLTNTNNNSNTDPDSTSPSNASLNDVQFLVQIAYSGDMKLGVSATLQLNHPTPGFVSLPLKLSIKGVKINSLAVVASIANRICLSFICDVQDVPKGTAGSTAETTTAEQVESHTPDLSSAGLAILAQDKIDILKELQIESEIGYVANQFSDNEYELLNQQLSHHPASDTGGGGAGSEPTTPAPGTANAGLSGNLHTSSSTIGGVSNREENMGPVLRNVGKVEKFLLERLRTIARDELAWPGWLTLEI